MNILHMINGTKDLWVIPKSNLINFERMQEYTKQCSIIILNTLSDDMQHCLIINTVSAEEEVNIVEQGLKEDKLFIIYGKHYYDNNLIRKYQQLKKLGAYSVYVYGGGMFEWLLLQDIYSKEEFPTIGSELDILKYKP